MLIFELDGKKYRIRGAPGDRRVEIACVHPRTWYRYWRFLKPDGKRHSDVINAAIKAGVL